MQYRIFFKKSAEKELARLPSPVIVRMQIVILNLAKEPTPAQSKKIVGYKGLYRIRVGNYRIIYTIDKVIRIITITKIGHRKDIYRNM